MARRPRHALTAGGADRKPADLLLACELLQLAAYRRDEGRSPAGDPGPVDARAASTGAMTSRSVDCGPSALIARSRKPVARSATCSTSQTVEVSGGESSREIGWSPKPATATSPGIESPSSAQAA